MASCDFFGQCLSNPIQTFTHEQGVDLYCPAQTRKGVEPYAPQKNDGPGLRRWRERMANAAGQAIYARRPIHECVNARVRRQGLTQLIVRGIEKAKTILRWHALANNIRIANRLLAAA